MKKSRIDRELVRAYRRTAYEVCAPDGTITLRVGKRCPELDALLDTAGCSEWAFLTASNPRSIVLTEAANARRNAELRDYLATLGLTVLPGRGVPDDPGWEPERSVLVLGIAADRATRIGTMVEQNAILVGQVGQPVQLVFCPLPEARAGENLIDEFEGDLESLEDQLDALWEQAEVIGLWIENDQLPEKLDVTDLAILDSRVTAKRLASLRAGARPSAKELAIWRKAWAERATAEDDRGVEYMIAPIECPTRGLAYVFAVCSGNSFEGIERRIEGVFDARESAIAYLDASGVRL